MLNALANMMVPKRGALPVELQLLLPRGADQNQEDEGEGKVAAAPLTLHVVPDLREAVLCIAEDLADRPKAPDQAVPGIGN